MYICINIHICFVDFIHVLMCGICVCVCIYIYTQINMYLSCQGIYFELCIGVLTYSDGLRQLMGLLGSNCSDCCATAWFRVSRFSLYCRCCNPTPLGRTRHRAKPNPRTDSNPKPKPLNPKSLNLNPPPPKIPQTLNPFKPQKTRQQRSAETRPRGAW